MKHFDNEERWALIPQNICSSIIFHFNVITKMERSARKQKQTSGANIFCMAVSHCVYIFGSGTHLEVTTAGQPAVPPKVHLFPPSSEELTSKRKGTLVCLIDDFIPGDIDVTWLADGSPITSNVETTRPTKRNDKYVASSYLSLTAAEYEEKDTFTCKVTHDSKDYQKSVQRAACSA